MAGLVVMIAIAALVGCGRIDTASRMSEAEGPPQPTLGQAGETRPPKPVLSTLSPAPGQPIGCDQPAAVATNNPAVRAQLTASADGSWLVRVTNSDETPIVLEAAGWMVALDISGRFASWPSAQTLVGAEITLAPGGSWENTISPVLDSCDAAPGTTAPTRISAGVYWFVVQYLSSDGFVTSEPVLAAVSDQGSVKPL